MHLNCTNPYKNQQREQLQLLFDQCFLNGNKSGLREQYKILRQIELNHNIDDDNEIIDISSLTQNISVACDVLIAETGVISDSSRDATGEIEYNFNKDDDTAL